MRIPVFPIGAPIVIDPQAEQNANAITEKESALLEKRNVVLQGGGQKYIDRTHAKGKMTAWERIEWMCDDDAPILPVGTLVNWGVVFTMEGEKDWLLEQDYLPSLQRFTIVG